MNINIDMCKCVMKKIYISFKLASIDIKHPSNTRDTGRCQMTTNVIQEDDMKFRNQ